MPPLTTTPADCPGATRPARWRARLSSPTACRPARPGKKPPGLRRAKRSAAAVLPADIAPLGLPRPPVPGRIPLLPAPLFFFLWGCRCAAPGCSGLRFAPAAEAARFAPLHIPALCALRLPAARPPCRAWPRVLLPDCHGACCHALHITPHYATASPSGAKAPCGSHSHNGRYVLAALRASAWLIASPAPVRPRHARPAHYRWCALRVRQVSRPAIAGLPGGKPIAAPPLSRRGRLAPGKSQPVARRPRHRGSVLVVCLVSGPTAARSGRSWGRAFATLRPCAATSPTRPLSPRPGGLGLPRFQVLLLSRPAWGFLPVALRRRPSWARGRGRLVVAGLLEQGKAMGRCPMALLSQARFLWSGTRIFFARQIARSPFANP